MPSANLRSPILVGITGQIACGKSTVAAEFRRLGATIISGDTIGREVVESDRTVLKRLERRFGSGILTKNRRLNRRKLGKLVFADQRQTEALNRIVHPLLLKKLRAEVARYRKLRTSKLLVVDAALIYTWGLERELDFVIVVESKLNTQAARLKRLGMSETEIRDRIRRQVPKYVQRQNADFVITNDGSLQQLKSKARKLYERLVKGMCGGSDC